ncbi:RusA family crossover junction endodeoxyribonuclease [Thiomicrorhabdus cannonii]|uniref:RusA family crossover junction endodeoxyribonuclease n=1 Tax=Thiomicrorhabdus cannonii TaxID=2748011 RepID=UPI0015BB2EBD|nr:RusA family crossover junction endodeoxyribonuclease [Thiomicrorhabdus cannonii]
MLASYQITLPWAPSANTYYRRAGQHIHLSLKGRQFKAAVAQVLQAQGLHRERISHRLRVRIELYPPNRRKFDIDNRIKPLLDALQHGGLFVDDEQIDRLAVARGDIDPERAGYCLVSIDGY